MGITERLDAIAAEASRRLANPTGSSVDAFKWDWRRDGHSLVFTHGGLRMRMSGFKAVDPKKWGEDDKHRHYPATHPSGVGLLWCAADIEWTSGKLKGGASNMALGYPHDRDRALSGLAPNTPERTALNDLMCNAEKLIGALYGDEFTKGGEDANR